VDKEAEKRYEVTRGEEAKRLRKDQKNNKGFTSDNSADSTKVSHEGGLKGALNPEKNWVGMKAGGNRGAKKVCEKHCVSPRQTKNQKVHSARCDGGFDKKS